MKIEFIKIDDIIINFLINKTYKNGSKISDVRIGDDEFILYDENSEIIDRIEDEIGLIQEKDGE